MIDVTALDDGTLRELVRQWRPGESADVCATAEAAHRELVVRFDVDTRLGRRPLPVATPPWQVPSEQRLRSWERPTRSTIYPDAP